MVVNLADRQVVNILAQDIKTDLALSDTQLGLLTGLAFASVYAVIGLPTAWLADRANRARVIALMLGFWSLCTIACGAATSFVGLFLARMGVGAGEGGAQPACTALVRDLYPSRASTALALVMAGNPLGSFIGFIAGGAIAEQWGWRAAFVLLGLPGLLLAGIVWLGVGEPRPASSVPAANNSFAGDLRRIVCQPRIPLLIAVVSGSMLLVYAIGAWLPAYFIRAYGFGTAQMGFYGALATGLCGGLGTLAGLLCDRLGTRIRHIESKFVMLVTAAAIPLLLITVVAREATVALSAYFLLNFAAFAWLAPGTRLIQDAVDPAERALAFAVCGGGGLLVSLGLGIPLIGWASDLLAPSFGPRSLGAALGLVVPVVAAVTIAGHLCLLRTPAGPSPH